MSPKTTTQIQGLRNVTFRKKDTRTCLSPLAQQEPRTKINTSFQISSYKITLVFLSCLIKHLRRSKRGTPALRPRAAPEAVHKKYAQEHNNVSG